ELANDKSLRAPRTRGWTVAQLQKPADTRESPAHAGMDLRAVHRSWCRCGEPRARGDGPTTIHTDPPSTLRAPRTRGWTAIPAPHRRPRGESPAHAGMDRPHEVPRAVPRPRGPRTRGRRWEEKTSELQSRVDIVCSLLHEKK